MYSPLNAAIFVPFSFLAPAVALTVWQVLLASTWLATCAALSHMVPGTRTVQIFLLSFLFTPIFQAIYMGQLAIPFGVLPLTFGCLLLLKGRDLPAGLVFSITALNPKYLPIAGLICIVLAMRKRFHSLSGLLAGIVLFVICNLALFGTGIFASWLRSAASAENAFYDPRVIYLPTHLLASLPASVLVSVPPDLHLPAKLIIYSLSIVIIMIAMWECWKLARSAREDQSLIRMSTAMLAFGIPLVEPHLLTYDLSSLFLASIIMFGQPLADKQRQELTILVAIAWLAIDIQYLICTYTPLRPHPFILVAVLLEIYRRLLRLIAQTRLANV
jgi:hypothetical protein